MDIIVLGMEGFGYTYRLSDGNKDLDLNCDVESDFYLNLYTSDFSSEDEFCISKENKAIYDLFYQLIEDVKNANVYKPNDYELSKCETDTEKLALIQEYQKDNLELKKGINYQNLYQNGVITWVSDEDSRPFDEQSDTTLKISTQDNIIKLQFKEPKQKEETFMKSIRFRKEGSRYYPFNMIFLRFCKELTKVIYEEAQQENISLQKIRKEDAL